MPGAPSDRPLVLFDGVCNLCHRAVLWIIRRDGRRDARGRRGRFDFASLQSRIAGETLQRIGGTAPLPESIVVVDGDRIFTKSDAALAIAQRLRFPWPLLARMAAIVPRSWRDAVYGAIARRRYRWFGRRDSCVAPTADLEARFLDAGEWRPGDERPTMHAG